MGNYVIGVGNYVIATPSEVGNYLIADTWRRRQRIRSGMVVTTRKALADSPPLIIAIPQGWRVVAGIGAAPTAADINHGWYPVSIRTAIRLLRDGITTIRTSQEIPRADRGMSNNGTAR